MSTTVPGFPATPTSPGLGCSAPFPRDRGQGDRRALLRPAPRGRAPSERHPAAPPPPRLDHARPPARLLPASRAWASAAAASFWCQRPAFSSSSSACCRAARCSCWLRLSSWTTRSRSAASFWPSASCRPAFSTLNPSMMPGDTGKHRCRGRAQPQPSPGEALEPPDTATPPPPSAHVALRAPGGRGEGPGPSRRELPGHPRASPRRPSSSRKGCQGGTSPRPRVAALAAPTAGAAPPKGGVPRRRQLWTPRAQHGCAHAPARAARPPAAHLPPCAAPA